VPVDEGANQSNVGELGAHTAFPDTEFKRTRAVICAMKSLLSAGFPGSFVPQEIEYSNGIRADDYRLLDRP